MKKIVGIIALSFVLVGCSSYYDGKPLKDPKDDHEIKCFVITHEHESVSGNDSHEMGLYCKEEGNED
jgi:hypothetical protein